MHWTHIVCTTLLGLGAAASPEPPKSPSPATPTVKAKAKAKPSRAGSKTAPKTRALAERVQRFYDRLEDFEAKFVQTYTRRALSRTTESSGVLTIKKGGKVHWSYARPAEKLFVADGATLWIYEPEEMQVIVDETFSTEKLGGSIAFLWGKGTLDESFEVTTPGLEEHDFGASAQVLELVPREDRTYRKLMLKVDPKSGQVLESVVYETSGNTNRFRFTQPKVNQGIPDSKFEFVPPRGVDIVKARPS